MVQLATNNAYALVPGAVSSLDTSITVETGKGTLFPIVGTGDYFYATLVDVVGNSEIIKATARAGDVLTVLRAQQGTVALPFPANSRIELRITAESIVSSGGGGASDAANVLYTPVDLTDWNGNADPGQVDDALDQLADRVNGLETLHPEDIIIACSDETTALTTGTAKITFRMPYAMTLDQVRASLSTAQASGASIFMVDINQNGTSILSTKLTIDNTEKTSTTAATPAVISNSALANDAEITIDIDQIGDGTAKGLKVTLTGTRA